MKSLDRYLLVLAACVCFFAIYILFVGSSFLSEGVASTSLAKIVRPEKKISQPVEIILTGDVMLGRTVMTTSLDLNDPVYPFRKVADTLRSADIVFANLENPIIKNCPRHTDGFKFCADPRMVEGLTFSGIDVVNLANNHTLNYGKEGLEETKNFLTSSKIDYVGVGNLVTKEVEGNTFGFLGFDMVDNQLSKGNLELIKTSDTKVDVLIVGVHWGTEYTQKASEIQREWANLIIENGADVIVGHHPHWVQEIEYISQQNTTGANLNHPTGGVVAAPVVYYSLGNFVFDQMWSQKTREGLAIRLTFRDSELIGEEKLPTYMTSWAQPEFVR